MLRGGPCGPEGETVNTCEMTSESAQGMFEWQACDVEEVLCDLLVVRGVLEGHRHQCHPCLPGVNKDVTESVREFQTRTTIHPLIYV